MFFVRLLSRLPFPVLYAISDFLYLIGYKVLSYRKQMVRKNLNNTFPHLDANEIKAIEKDFYHNLCDYAVETLKLMTMNGATLKKRMHFKNPEIVDAYKEKNQSLLLLASHQFNWEWLIASANIWLTMNVDYVYQAQRSEFVNQFAILTRSKFGSLPIKRSEVMRDIVRNKDKVRGIAIVADQFPGHGNDKRYWTSFLNLDTAFFEAINTLAFHTQYPTYFAKINHVSRGYYEMEFIEVAMPPYTRDDKQVIENYIKATEKVIKEYPSGWLWSHNRWKKKRDD
ncbi:MAG: lysophospholipid acyltransferase family protein [Cyclobacteriaceae bacterium]